MYKAIRFFKDLEDNGYVYHTGDVFPRDGANVSDERIAELMSDKNKRHAPLIEDVDEEAETKKSTRRKRAKK